MLHGEFENLTGLQVSEEEFNAINAMYETASHTIDKQTFCKDWMKHKDSVLLNDYYNQACRFEKQVKEHKEVLQTIKENLGAGQAVQEAEFDEVI